MKKLLIATSAVVGLGVVSADFAAAQLEVSFSGLVRVRMTKGTQTTAGVATSANYAPDTTFGVNRAQLQWDAKGTSDSGLTYGARIRVRPTGTSGGRHLTYIYAGGGFGKVTLGNQYGISGGSVYAGAGNASSGSGGVDGHFSCSAGTVPAAGSNASLACPVADGAWARFDGVGYSSPNFGGAQVHADFSLGNGSKNDGDGKGHMGLGLTYSADIGDGSVNAAATYYKERVESVVNGVGVVTESGVNAPKILQLAVDGTFGPVTVGMNYLSSGKSGASKTLTTAGALKGGQSTMLLAAKYNYGPGSVSLGYGRGSADTHDGAGGSYKDKTTTIVLSASYSVAPGWSVYGDYYRFSNKTGRAAVADNSESSNAWVIGSNVSF